MSDPPLSPAEQVRRLYEDAEGRTGTAMETLVSSQGFAEILSMVTGNVMALTQLANSGRDQLVRGLRVAGRSDIARLGRQLARTEDKLEQLLQLVEKLEQQLVESQSSGAGGRGASVKGDGGVSTPRRSSSTRSRSARGMK